MKIFFGDSETSLPDGSLVRNKEKKLGVINGSIVNKRNKSKRRRRNDNS